MSSTPIRGLLVVALLTALAGLVDATRGGQEDLAVLFGALTVLLGALLVSAFGRRHRQPLALRADLARWLDDRSALTGEPVERLLDRAVAEHRDAVAGQPAAGEERVP